MSYYQNHVAHNPPGAVNEFCLRIWCVGVGGIHLSSFSIAVSPPDRICAVIDASRDASTPTFIFVVKHAVHFGMRGTLGKFRNWTQQNGTTWKKTHPT